MADRAEWLDEKGNMPGIERCFKVDSLSTVAGSLFCMPVMTTYLESASGVEDGGRTGMTSIVASVLFVLMLLFYAIGSDDSQRGHRACAYLYRFANA